MTQWYYRPWGSYGVLAEYYPSDEYGGVDYNAPPNCVVKHIIINPGARFSLQYHHYRYEYWTVIAGKGKVTIGDDELSAHPGSVFKVPKGVIHRAEASADTSLVFIEVQLGDECREDDIVRVEDDFGRD